MRHHASAVAGRLRSLRLRKTLNAVFTGILNRSLSIAILLASLLAIPAAGIAQIPLNADNQQLITILSPAFNAVLPDGNVTVRLHLRQDLLPETFTANLNGNDVSEWLNGKTACDSGSICELSAALPEDLLAPGMNVLTVAVEAESGAAAEARVQFEYGGGLSVAAEDIRHLVASVRLNANYLRPNSDPSNIRNWEIRVGPGPDFPQRAYPAADAGCNATDSIMALVLDKSTLAPDAAIAGGTNHVGQACFTSAAEFANFLKSVKTGQIVIGSSFFGLVRNLNTTAAGGTDYSKSNAPLPRYYAFVGAAGANPGTAYESYHPARTGREWVPPFVGNLALNNLQQYFFVPSTFDTLEVNPDTRVYPVVIGDEGYFTYWPREDPGGFILLAFDRRLGTVVHLRNYTTNPRSGNQNDMLDLIDALSSNSSSDRMLVLTSFGQPFANPQGVNPTLSRLIDNLGGTGALMTGLAKAQSNGLPISYTLITSNDPEYLSIPGNVIERTSLLPNQTGRLKALLGKDRKNQWGVLSVLAERPDIDNTTQLSSLDWLRVPYEPAQDWPAWTPGQRNAYNDLTSPRYPTIQYSLGCFVDNCPPIRSYYSGVIGGGGSAALRIRFGEVSYSANTSYSSEDLQAVVTQLRKEQGYLGNVQAIYNQFSAVTGATQGSIQFELTKMAKNFDAGLASRNQAAATSSRQLLLASGITSFGSALPAVGSGFSALSSILRAAATLWAVPSSLPEDFNITISSLRDNTSTLGIRLASSNNVLFTGVVTDWGKLQTIGGGYGAQKAPWYMCTTCKDSNIPSAAIPVTTLAAKRDFYLRLLPKVYTVDQYRNKKSKEFKKFGYMAFMPGGGEDCLYPYASAPSAATVLFNAPGQVNQYDIGFLVATDYSTNWAGHKVVNYPAGSLLNDLFNNPTVNSDGTLGGGSGFSIETFFTSTPGRPLPVRQAFSTNPICGPQ